VREKTHPNVDIKRCKQGETQQLEGVGSGGDQPHVAPLMAQTEGAAARLLGCSPDSREEAMWRDESSGGARLAKDCRQPSDARTNSGPSETVEGC